MQNSENAIFTVEEENLPLLVKIITDYKLVNEILGQDGEGSYFVEITFEEGEEEIIPELLEIAEIIDEEEFAELFEEDEEDED